MPYFTDKPDGTTTFDPSGGMEIAPLIEIARSQCAYCEQIITADCNGRNVLTWGAHGDYGCDAHPLSNEYVNYDHQPATRRAVTLHLEARYAWDNGTRGDEYVNTVRTLAFRLKIGL